MIAVLGLCVGALYVSPGLIGARPGPPSHPSTVAVCCCSEPPELTLSPLPATIAHAKALKLP